MSPASFAALGRFAVRRRWWIVGAYAAFLPVAAWLGSPVLGMLRVGGFEDRGAESWRVRSEMVRELGVGVADVIALYTARSGSVDDPVMQAGVMDAVRKVEAEPGVLRVMSYYTSGATILVSKHRTATFIIVTLSGDNQARQETFERIKGDFAVESAAVAFAGFVPVNEALSQTIGRDLRRAELIAFPITAALLLVIFGGVVAAATPFLLGGLAVEMSFLILRLLTMMTDLSVFAANIVTLLGLGLAVDYSLFIVSRYREELPSRGVTGAVERTIATAGRAVAFSGVTVAASLLGLFVFPQMYLHSIALGGLCVTLGALVLGVTLLPALLAIIGRRIDALALPFSIGGSSHGEEQGVWHVIAPAVMKRPALVVLGITIPLVLLGLPVLRLDPSIPDYRMLPVHAPPRATTEALNRDFQAHQLSAHDVLVHTPGPALTATNLEALYTLDRRMRQIDGVVEVQGIFSSADQIGKGTVIAVLGRPRAEQDPVVRAALASYVNGNVLRFAVVSADDFNAPRALQQVAALRALSPPDGFTVEVGGIAAILYDLRQSIRQRAPWMVLAVACVMFVVLFVVFGSVTLPLKAVVMSALSLTASLGAIVWVFQDGRFTWLLRYTPLGVSDATQPILMFAVVFGLSMDYEVLLLMRVREEYVRTGDNTLSVSRGLTRSGRLITNAALLLVVVIGAFATSELVLMKTLGFGMALAVTLEATVVRVLLVPATMRIMGKWNWWSPAPLARLWQTAGLSDLEEGAEKLAMPSRKEGS
jgi:trehalose monomycolate/heme transporter